MPDETRVEDGRWCCPSCCPRPPKRQTAKITAVVRDVKKRAFFDGHLSKARVGRL